MAFIGRHFACNVTRKGIKTKGFEQGMATQNQQVEVDQVRSLNQKLQYASPKRGTLGTPEIGTPEIHREF